MNVTVLRERLAADGKFQGASVRATLPLEFAAWLDRAVSTPIPEGVVAFNFNLAEAYQKFRVDVVGATHYDAVDSDWACDEAFVPQIRFFDLPHSETGKRWQDAQELVRGFVVDYIRAAPDSSPLRKATAVTVGFVDGELVRVWPEQ